MATAKPTPSIQPSRWRRRLLLLAGLAALVALAWFWRPLTADAVAATAYGARVACPCRFVAGRSLPDCDKDFEPDMALVLLSEDAEAKSVTAWIPLLASQTAVFREGRGCTLKRWPD